MDWQVAYLQAAGAPITAANLKFLNTWQPYEGGHTHNSATNNYFNSEMPMPGSRSMGGGSLVQAYPTLADGAHAFAATLEKNRNYSGLLQGFRSGDPFKMGSRAAAGLSTWVSGSPTGNLGYADKILGSTTAATTVPSTLKTPDIPQQPSLPDIGGAIAMNLTPGTSPQQQLTNLVNAVAAGQPSPAAQLTSPTVTPAPAPMRRTSGAHTGLFNVIPSGLSTRPGIRIAAGLLPEVKTITSEFGVKVNSGYRTAALNKSVGGAENSDHLRGDAVDFVGTQAQMRKLYEWAQHRFPYVEPWAQTGGNHVHISFARP